MSAMTADCHAANVLGERNGWPRSALIKAVRGSQIRKSESKNRSVSQYFDQTISEIVKIMAISELIQNGKKSMPVCALSCKLLNFQALTRPRWLLFTQI